MFYKIPLFRACNDFRIFTELCTHHHNLRLEHFIIPKKKPCLHSAALLVPPTAPSPWQPLLYFLPVWAGPLPVVSVSGFSHVHNVSEVAPCRHA